MDICLDGLNPIRNSDLVVHHRINFFSLLCFFIYNKGLCNNYLEVGLGNMRGGGGTGEYHN